jgi:hypothetical protein
MRYVMTALVVNFRPTLVFFSKRDAAMSELYPKEFPDWMHGENHFNLVDTKTRRAIRFEASRFIVRVEGQDSLDPFRRCVEMALSMLDSFNIVDIFAMQFESIQARIEKRLCQARLEFAKTFIPHTVGRLFPQDEHTDYTVVVEREEQVDNKLTPAGARISQRELLMNSSISLGPASRQEIEDKWLEFKEKSPNPLYKTKPRAPQAAQLFAMKIVIRPKKNIKQIPVETLKTFYPLIMDQSVTYYDKIFRSE